VTTSPLADAAAAFAAELAQWRVRRGLSKKRLAAEMGFDPSYVSHVEGRRHRPTEDFAKRAEGVLRADGAIWSRFVEYHGLRHGTRGMPGVPQADPWLPPGTGLLVEHESAHLSYADGVYHCVVRRALYNAGPEPVTRYPVRVAVDRYPDEPERSNRYYREHPLTWAELDLHAVWESGEPMRYQATHDLDSLKEVWVVFENDQSRFPLYQGQRAAFEYRYRVGEAKWGRWFQRAVRIPTRHLSVRLDFPATLRPAVWGVQTSLAAEAVPLGSPVRERVDGGRTVFEWSTEHPPLHTRYRMQWRFRAGPGVDGPDPTGTGAVPPRPPRPAAPPPVVPEALPARDPTPAGAGAAGAGTRMATTGILQRGSDLLTAPARELDLPAQAAYARDIVARLGAALDRVSELHTFSKGVGLAAGQLGIGHAVALVWPPDDQPPVVLLNPRIRRQSPRSDERYEGCLSFFDVRGLVRRPLWIEVEHRTFDGDLVVTVFERGPARLVAHEIDHLRGRLYLERMPPGTALVPVAEYRDAGRPWRY